MPHNHVSLINDQLRVTYLCSCANAFDAGINILKTISAKISERQENSRRDEIVSLNITLPYSVDKIDFSSVGGSEGGAFCTLCAGDFTTMCQLIKDNYPTPNLNESVMVICDKPVTIIESYRP